MINGFEYRDHTPKCPERSDKWLNEPCWDEQDTGLSDEELAQLDDELKAEMIEYFESLERKNEKR